MIPKLIRLGVQTILKIICEKIIIKNIKIVQENYKFNGKIDELYIKAESIIFNKINIDNINIFIRDLVLRLEFNKEKCFIENCHAEIHMRLTIDSINKTLFNNKWISLRNSIENFISMSFKSLDIKNNSIYFIPLEGTPNENINYTLQYDKKSISLVNNINQKNLSILNDKNISVKNLFLCESYIELELSSKIIFN